MHTQIRFSYIFCAAYHVIAETYAHWWADMCAGPWVHREGEGYMVHWKKILLILLLSSFFFFLFSFLVSSSAVLSAFFSARCKILPLALPSTAVPYETKLDFWFCLLVLAFLFVLFFSLTLSFPPLSCVLSTVETSRTKTPKMMNNSPWQLRGYCLGSYFWANSIPPFFFFFFFASCTAPHVLTAPTFFLFPSLFSPPPPQKLLLTLPSFLFPYFMTPSFQIPPPHFFSPPFFFFFLLFSFPPPIRKVGFCFHFCLGWQDCHFAVTVIQYPTVSVI